MYRAISSRTERSRLLIKPFATEDMEMRFRSILQPRLVRFDDAKEQLLRALSDRVTGLRRRLDMAALSLEAGSPQSIMERGYSVVMTVPADAASLDSKEKGAIVRSASDTKPGDRLIIRPMKGLITARTEEVDLTSQVREE
jgi:exodeoxyribonuclease VII large subunit